MSATGEPIVSYSTPGWFVISGQNEKGSGDWAYNLDACIQRLVGGYGLSSWRATILVCRARLDGETATTAKAAKADRYRLEVVEGGQWGVVDTERPHGPGRTLATCADMEDAYAIASLLNAYPEEWSTPLTAKATR